MSERRRSWLQMLGATIVLLVLVAAGWPAGVQGQGPQPDGGTQPVFEEWIRRPGPLPPRLETTRAEPAGDSKGLSLWDIKTIYNTSTGYTSLRLDAVDQPHIGFYSSDSHFLKYGYHDGTAWHFEDVVQGIGGISFAMALDKGGQPHFGYCDSNAGNLMYARREGLSWHTEVAGWAGYGEAYISIALDANGRPHISYFDSGGLDLKYAYHDGSAWHTTTVDSSGDVGKYNSLALDSGGRPHISYYRADTSDLKYAYYDGSSWQVRTVEAAGVTGLHTSIAVDNAGHPHISYVRLSSSGGKDSLRYAYHDGSGWQMQMVASFFGGPPYNTSLALDKVGQPYISFVGDATLYLSYLDGFDWHRVLVDGMAGCSFLAIDADGRPRIAYGGIMQLRYGTLLSDLYRWADLVFASYRDGNFNVYAARGDGTYQSRLTTNKAADYLPEFNRGATLIAFTASRTGNMDIFKMNADGSAQTRLTYTSYDEYLPTWSPDSSKIAFYAYPEGSSSTNAEIYVMNADGSGLTRLTNDPAWDGHPTWSPDGSKIAFVSDRNGGYQLWTMHPDGSNQQQLTTGVYDAAYPDWSPDGTKIVFNDDSNGDGWYDVAVVDADGAGLTHPFGMTPAERHYLAPVWSPLGQDLAYAEIDFTYYHGNWYWTSADIWRRNLNPWPSDLAPLVNSGYDWWPDWQPTDVLAPYSAVTPLPESSGITFTVTWSGMDPGGSWIASYDVQYRDETSGTWSDWLVGTTEKMGVFAGVVGHSYYFRCRARDYAGNLESYPSGDGDTYTHIPYGTVPGVVRENRDQVVVQALLQSSPPAMNAPLSGPHGEFTFYFSSGGSYDLSASRCGFGSLPPMKGVAVFSGTTPPVAFYLPPADDQVEDGGFEAGNLAAWSPSGDVTPTLTTTAHTGDDALLFATMSPPLVTPTTALTASRDVPPAGGAFSSTLAMLEVPAGALAATTTFTLTGVPTVTNQPAGVQEVGVHVAVTAALTDGTPITHTLLPFTLTVTYDENAWKAAQVEGEGTLALWRYDAVSVTWVLLGGTVDPVSNTVTVETALPGLFALFGEPEMGPWRSAVEQEVVLSPTAVPDTLSLLYRVEGADAASDTLQVILEGPAQAVTYTLPLTVSGWVHRWWPLPAWASPAVSIRVEWLQGKREGPGGVLLDEVSLGTTRTGLLQVYLPLVLKRW